MQNIKTHFKKYSVPCFVVIALFFGLTAFAQNDPTEILPTLAPENSAFMGSYTGNCDPKTNADCYQFLEALPTSQGDLTSVNTAATGKKGGLGDFISFVFEIGVGIAGIVGVIMLTVYGFQYAANDKNIATFEVLKDRITQIILGLLLLLSIFIILRTINPDLLILEPEINTRYLDVEGGDGVDPGDSVPADVPPGNVATKSCPAGVTSVYGTNVCKTISEKYKNMIDAAKVAGINLSGGGYRTMEEQITLRNKNCGCGGNQSCIATKSPSQCTPPTARPGDSRHQSGLAIDMKCDGAIINKSKRPNTKKCFDWLVANASKYGFFNLPSENWHWSIDGK